MALPTRYLTTAKNLEGIFNAIGSAQAPQVFSQTFLGNLGFKSSGDRLVIGVLKSIGFLTEDGKPTQRYFRFLDQSQSKAVVAEGVREAYSDLFQLNIKSNEMTAAELKNKMKTLTEGKPSEDVLRKMAMTFTSLVQLADFSGPIAPTQVADDEEDVDLDAPVEESGKGSKQPRPATGISLGYNIHLNLPESRDPAVYDALFKSLRQHLVR